MSASPWCEALSEAHLQTLVTDTCPCGYRVITHTTIEASRYHVLAVRRHKHECKGGAA